MTQITEYKPLEYVGSESDARICPKKYHNHKCHLLKWALSYRKLSYRKIGFYNTQRFLRTLSGSGRHRHVLAQPVQAPTVLDRPWTAHTSYGLLLPATTDTTPAPTGPDYKILFLYQHLRKYREYSLLRMPFIRINRY